MLGKYLCVVGKRINTKPVQDLDAKNENENRCQVPILHPDFHSGGLRDWQDCEVPLLRDRKHSMRRRGSKNNGGNPYFLWKGPLVLVEKSGRLKI